MIVEPETENQFALQLGDLTMVGMWPGKMIKALATIAHCLHDAYDLFPNTQIGGSREACLFTSLAIRDFLVAIGYGDATARACACYMRSTGLDGKEIWSLGIGKPDEPDIPERFNGHAVCTVPSLNLMIDATLYPAIRPQWGGALLGMMALSYYPPVPTKVYGRSRFAGLEIGLADRRFEIMWCDRPEIKWKRAPDFERTPRRRHVTAALVEAFGEWQD